MLKGVKYSRQVKSAQGGSLFLNIDTVEDTSVKTIEEIIAKAKQLEESKKTAPVQQTKEATQKSNGDPKHLSHRVINSTHKKLSVLFRTTTRGPKGNTSKSFLLRIHERENEIILTKSVFSKTGPATLSK